MKKGNVIKLIAPVFVFPVLFFPYQLLNSAVIVKWLGCGCPKIDASGEMIHDYFNANDFTRIFWFVVAVGITMLAWLLSKKIFSEKKWARWIYMVGMFVVSLVFVIKFCQMMMWN